MEDGLVAVLCLKFFDCLVDHNFISFDHPLQLLGDAECLDIVPDLLYSCAKALLKLVLAELDSIIIKTENVNIS